MSHPVNPLERKLDNCLSELDGLSEADVFAIFIKTFGKKQINSVIYNELMPLDLDDASEHYIETTVADISDAIATILLEKSIKG